MTARRFVRIAVMLAMWVSSTRLAMAQGVGAIGGTVTDASGAVMPGVTVTLSNPRGSIGGNQEAVTDARGAFQFLRLVPGTYTVKAELEGFRTAVLENIVVNADVTARVDLKLEIGTLQEGITVTGESPLLDTTSALKQTVLSREVLDSLPNRIDVWSVARVIPSVVLSKVDVGGSESFLQSTATVHGSNNENGFLIDGMDVSNLDGNGTGAVLYLDPYAFQETNYQTSGGGTAISSKGGLLFNMVTRTGTNQFHGGAMFNGANHGMSSANYSDELRADLLAGIPDIVRQANPNIVPGADILKIYDVGAWLAGPVVRDKLWFSFSAHDQALDQYLLGNYNPDGTQVLDDNLMWTLASKVAWQMTRTAQLSYFNNLQYKLIGHRNGGGTFAESRARNLNDKYPDVHQMKFTSPIGSRVVVDASWSRFRADDMFGQEPEVQAGDISRFDAVSSTYLVALPTYRDNAMFRDQVLTSMGYFTGRHDIRFGYQFIDGGEKSSNWSTSGMRAVYRSGKPDSVNTYNVPILSTSEKIPVAFEPWHRDHGVFIQDKWTPTARLTLNLGLRFETTYGLAAGHLPSIDDVRRRAVLPGDQRRAGLQGDRPAPVGRLRRLRRRQDGNQGLGQPLRSADHAEQRAARQPARHRERHARLDRLRGRAARRLRSQRRSHAAAERARRVERVRVRHEQPLRRRPRMAGVERVQPRAAASASGQHRPVSRVHAA
ncbi:MAG TPA: carboxypeptidase regulatory-like domain-containing protein [Vicinamibacterales bacterium]|nr:carboxypeptidase regulatory-like domain-containing protein [Vicinamibacterales bacterium]